MMTYPTATLGCCISKLNNLLTHQKNVIMKSQTLVVLNKTLKKNSYNTVDKYKCTYYLNLTVIIIYLLIFSLIHNANCFATTHNAQI